MSMTLREALEVKDDELFVITGKDLKKLAYITVAVRGGPDRNHYNWGHDLGRVVCGVNPCPDFQKLLETKKGIR